MQRFNRRMLALSAFAISAVLLAGCSSGAAGEKAGTSDVPVLDRFGAATETVGPNGEKPTSASELTLSDAQKADIASGGYRAAILWHELSSWTKAIQGGIQDELAELGVTVVATSDAKFDAATQANQIETTLALQPDVILGQAVDPSTAGAAYQPAVDQGVKLVFADQAPDAYDYGDQYQAVITDDLFQIGERAANQLGEALGGKGEVAVVYYDAEFHVTNFRDAAFLTTLHREFPDITVVAKQGFSDPNKAEEIANALMTKHPNLAGIYTSWAVPAQGVLAALRNAGNTTTKIVTVDLDDTIATDLAGGGNVVGIVADRAYDYGRAMATAAALALLGEPAPAFGITDSVTVTKDTIAKGYEAWNEPLPSAVQNALK
ncbi:MAG: Monosaccharide transporter substrate-binding protein family [Microbacteriaceae bacterium]|jgi:ribose transport system substrate-binding protein|nr:Monosaccharide transporter substrate-binding protein family [Microbacteriaceae bacterium]